MEVQIKDGHTTTYIHVESVIEALALIQSRPEVRTGDFDRIVIIKQE